MANKKAICYKQIADFYEVVGMTGFEPAASSSRTMRATKLCHIPPNTINIIYLLFIKSKPFKRKTFYVSLQERNGIKFKF